MTAPCPSVPSAGSATQPDLSRCDAPAYAASQSPTGATASSGGQAPVLNIANFLTVLRLVSVPIFAVVMLEDAGKDAAWRLVAAAVFVAASITDRFDGQLARKRGLVTDFGKVADPIADKALCGMALIALSLVGELWWWVTAAILIREFGITALRFWVIRYGVIAASRGGKLKTLLQILAIVLYVLPLGGLAAWSWLSWLSAAIMAAALVVTLVTGADYVLKASRLRGSARAVERGLVK